MKANNKQLYKIGQKWASFKSLAIRMNREITADQFDIKENVLTKSQASELITAIERINKEYIEHIASRGTFLEWINEEHLESIKDQLQADLITISKYYYLCVEYDQLFYFKKERSKDGSKSQADKSGIFKAMAKKEPRKE